MATLPRPQEIYRHFKGNLYQIVTLAEHTESGEQLVIYQALYGDYRIYARPLAMFTGKVDRKKYPEAKQEYRFERVEPENVQSAALAAVWVSKPEDAEKKPESAEPQPEDAETKPEDMEKKSMAVGPASADAEPDGEANLDPMLLEFLDADSHEEKLNILAGLHHRITQDMITTMAVASDIEVEDGELEERYRQLRSCLLMLDKFERSRT